MVLNLSPYNISQLLAAFVPILLLGWLPKAIWFLSFFAF